MTDRISISSLPAIEIEQEILGSGLSITSAVAARHHQLVAWDGASIWLLRDGDASAEELSDDALGLRGAARADSGELIVATEEGLRIATEGRLTLADLDGAIEGPPRGVASGDGALWIWSSAGAWRVRDGSLAALTDGGEPLAGPIAPGGRVDGEATTWLSAGGEILGLDPETLAIRDRRDIAAEALAIDGDHTLWACADGDIWSRADTGRWRRRVLSEPAIGVAAHPDAPGAWIATADALLYAEGDDLYRVELDAFSAPRLGAIRADQLGRALLADDEGLNRIGVRRALALVGLEDGQSIEGDLEIQLVPSALGEIAALSAEVDGVALEIDGDLALLDAAPWLDGAPHTLSASVAWSDGGSASASADFQVVGLDVVTWTEVIEPLYQDRCSLCHGGDSETVLDTSEDWQSNIDAILDMVTSGAMPIGESPLTEGEISMIESWRDGGYP